MKTTKKWFATLLILGMLASACGSGGAYHKGTATDRTGTNGATNGTGKVPR